MILGISEVNSYWFTISVDDPTVEDEERLWQIIYRLPKGDAKLSEMEIAAIEWLAVVINTWNRVAISSRYRVTPE